LKEAWWHKGGRVTVENPRQPRHKGGEKLSMKNLRSLLLCSAWRTERRLKTEVAKDEDGVRKKVMRR